MYRIIDIWTLDIIRQFASGVGIRDLGGLGGNFFIFSIIGPFSSAFFSFR